MQRGDRWLSYPQVACLTSHIHAMADQVLLKWSPFTKCKYHLFLRDNGHYQRTAHQNIFLSTVLLLRPQIRTGAVCFWWFGVCRGQQCLVCWEGGLLMSLFKEYCLCNNDRGHTFPKTYLCHFPFFCRNQKTVLHRQCWLASRVKQTTDWPMSCNVGLDKKFFWLFSVRWLY